MEATTLPMASEAVEVEVEVTSPSAAELSTVPTEVGPVLDTPCSIMRDDIRSRGGGRARWKGRMIFDRGGRNKLPSPRT